MRSGLVRGGVLLGVVGVVLATVVVTRPAPARPAVREPAATPVARAGSVVVGAGVTVGPAARTALAGVAGIGDVLVGPTTVRVFDPPLGGWDNWAYVTEGGVIDVPSPAAIDPAYRDNGAVLAMIGVGTTAFRRYVEAAPYSAAAVECERAYSALAARSHPLDFGPRSALLWVPSITGVMVSDTDFSLDFERVYASTIAVLRYFVPEFTRALRTLSDADRRAVTRFVRSVVVTFGESGAALPDLLPGLAALED